MNIQESFIETTTSLRHTIFVCFTLVTAFKVPYQNATDQLFTHFLYRWNFFNIANIRNTWNNNRESANQIAKSKNGSSP